MDIFDDRFACTDKDLLDWAAKNSIDASIITLQNLNKTNKQKNRFSFVFTGAKDDSFNNSNDHHWLALDGNLVFDSYGAYSQYVFPDHYQFFKTSPARLQEFNSVVCGAYCCAFLAFCYKYDSADEDLETLQDLFVEEYGFTNNRKLNDEKILEWYIKTQGQFSSPNTSIPVDHSGSTDYSNTSGATSSSINPSN